MLASYLAEINKQILKKPTAANFQSLLGHLLESAKAKLKNKLTHRLVNHEYLL